MYQRKLDLHVHTDNSPDGNHTAMFICEKAEFDGMRAIAFTDHCEVDSYKEESYDKRVQQAYFEMTKAQLAFRGKVWFCEALSSVSRTTTRRLPIRF